MLATFSQGKASFETSRQQLADLKSRGQNSLQVCLPDLLVNGRLGFYSVLFWFLIACLRKDFL